MCQQTVTCAHLHYSVGCMLWVRSGSTLGSIDCLVATYAWLCSLTVLSMSS